MLAFSNGLVKLACLTLPTHEDVKEMSETDKTLSLLDVRFLEKPAYAVEPVSYTHLYGACSWERVE